MNEEKMFIEKTGETIEGYLEYGKILALEPYDSIKRFRRTYKYIPYFSPHGRMRKFDGFSNVRVGTLEFEAYCGVNSPIGMNGFVMYEEK